MPLATYALQAGESARKNFPGVNEGPFKIVNDQNIVVAEQLIYKVSDVNVSFSETMALPGKQLDKNFGCPGATTTAGISIPSSDLAYHNGR